MSFQPTVPLGGLAGWRFLNRTFSRQTESYQKSPAIDREINHFREKISGVTSAADLVADRQLLKVALGAFGLQDDLNKGYFIRRVLEDGTTNPKAMANRLIDKRYANLSNAFGFGSAQGGRTTLSFFADEITKAYATRSFEVAVGNSNNNMRLALTFRREIGTIAARATGTDTAWFNVLSSPPTRKVLETALNLPSSFSSLDLDRQVATLKSKSRAMFGSDSVAVFQSADIVESTIDKFMLRAQLNTGGAAVTGNSAALAILQGGTSPGSDTLEALFSILY